MADRYWVAASATDWDSSTANWSATSGGPGGASLPSPEDNVFFNAGGAGNCRVINSVLVRSINFTGYSGTFSHTGSPTISLFSNLTLSSTMTWTYASALNFVGSAVITSAGKSLNSNISISGSIPGRVTNSLNETIVKLGDACVCGQITVSGGVFDTDGYSLTASSIVSNDDTTFRSIYLRSSTVTLSAASAFNFANNALLTFDAGTSTVNLSNNGANLMQFNTTGRPNFTFYNVAFTGTGLGTRAITFSCIMNNLTLSAPTTGVTGYSFGSNQVINGTLTCTSTSAITRSLLASSAFGTRITLRVASFTGSDCDFQYINITGAAAPIAPTRAGDRTGNLGITFPAPKTVYWNLAGTQDWQANAWAGLSGGSPSVNNFPLPQDIAVFNNAGSVGTVVVQNQYGICEIDTSARTTAMTLSRNDAYVIYGGLKIGSGVSYAGGSSATTFINESTKILSTAVGKTIDFNIVIGSTATSTGGVQLGSNITVPFGTFLVNGGTFDCSIYNFTFENFLSNNGSNVTLKFGSGTWTGTGASTVLQIYDANIVDSGTAHFIMSGTTNVARNWFPGSHSFYKLTIGGGASTGAVTFSGNSTYQELASTRTGAWTLNFSVNETTTVKTWSIKGTLGNVVTVKNASAGTWALNLTNGYPTGIDYLNVQGCNASTSPYEFYVGTNSVLTSCTDVFNTAPPASRTLYWVGGTGNWSDTARWSLGSGGLGGEPIPKGDDDVIFDAASNATAYTATVNAVSRCRNLTIAGPTSGNLTFAGSSGLTINGNATFPATGFTRSYTGTITLSGPSSATFTPNGQTFASTININAIDSTRSLGSNLNVGAATFSISRGTFNTANYSLTAASITSNTLSPRTISLGSSTVTLSATIPVIFNTQLTLTFNAGTSQINVTANTATFNGSNLTYYNVTFTDNNVSTTTLNGVNTFNNLTTLPVGVNDSVRNLSINGNQTITGTFNCAGTSPIRRCYVLSGTLGTPRTLTVNTLNGTDCDFRDIIITGTAAGSAQTRAGDCGGNSGIGFPAPKTVYWNLSGTREWQNNGWAPGSGGTPDINNFPLPQDTAVFDNLGAAGTVSFGLLRNYNISNINASARTLAMTLAHNNSVVVFYGSYILGSGVTVTGTNAINLIGTSTQILNSNGVTITCPIVIGAVGRSNTYVQIGGTTVVSNTITLTAGTFDKSSNNLTITKFISSNTNIRSLLMGSGVWSLSGNGTGVNSPWEVNTVSNLTFDKGTAEILYSDTTTTAREFRGGGLSYHKFTIGGTTGISTTTISGNNSFVEFSSIKTVAHTISIAGRQNVETWSVTGSVGNVVTLQASTTTAPQYINKSNGTPVTGVNYLNVRNIVATPLSDIWYIGPNSVINTTAPNIGAGMFTTNRSDNVVIVLTDLGGNPSWTVPDDWNAANNSINIIGGGAGGSGSARSTSRLTGGAGGGGGGFTRLTNQTLTPGASIQYVVGTGGFGGAAGNGGSGSITVFGNAGGATLWNSGASTANGGSAGNSTANPSGTGSSTGGSGGTGSTFNGGNGAAGAVTTTASTGAGGGGGGGAGGPNGAGGNGGAGALSSSGTNSVGGGGGGGNGGGTNGAAGTNFSGPGGAGGNNSLGVGAGGAGSSGAVGGGGGGGSGASPTGSAGGNGYEIYGAGSGGGSGGTGGRGLAINYGGFYGGGGGGGGSDPAGSQFSGGSGSQGAIIITYVPGAPAPTATGNMFFMFN